MSFNPVKIKAIEKHSDRLLFLSVEKPLCLKFTPGQFVRIGLALRSPVQSDEDILARPYSVASAPEANQLDFYIARVTEGELSGQFFDLTVGDTIYVDDEAYGLMNPQRLQPHGHLVCMGTGTGVSAFLSILKSNPWVRFEKVTVIHCARYAADLTVTHRFQEAAMDLQQEHNFQFIRLTTRETDENSQGELQGRLTETIQNGKLQEFGIELNPEKSRIILCGNPDFVSSMKKLLKMKGFTAPRGEKFGTLISENFW